MLTAYPLNGFVRITDNENDSFMAHRLLERVSNHRFDNLQERPDAHTLHLRE